MKKIQVLDCTLRDGGYINNWMFGEKYIQRIMDGLQDARIDIIECGYLSDQGAILYDSTNVRETEQFEKYIPRTKCEDLPSYVCMINYGDYRIDKLPDRKEGGIDGIRVAFHKKDMDEAILMCHEIQKKGYDVYIQPMVTLSYSDGEILEMLRRVNDIRPKALYIVDSYGSMRRRDLLRLFYLVTHNLDEKTIVGYHSHNNLQLAYSNAQALVEIAEKRNLIIDSSIFGMGRGAGNLNTELFIDFLNDFDEGRYNVAPLLKVMDNVISHIYMLTPWGYSLPYYLSAVHNCHPNYASYLAKKNTLTVENMDTVFSMIPEDKKNQMAESYAEALYQNYMNRGGKEEGDIEVIRQAVSDSSILLLAPGKTLGEDKAEILRFQSRNHVVTIAVNSDFQDFKTDYIFVSNIRRFEELDAGNYTKTIITDNIQSDHVFAKVSYQELENEDRLIKDNAGIMALSLLKMLGVKKVFLAGFDGYSAAMHDNYAAKSLYLSMDEDRVSEMNKGMKKAIFQLKRFMDIEFLTKSKLNSEDTNERE